MPDYKDHNRYPLTQMNFLVTVPELESGLAAAFSEVTGIDAKVDVITFRQGNSDSLAPMKIPGLVKHGNVTLKMGYIVGTGFKEWVSRCVNEQRDQINRQDITIELIDIRAGAPKAEVNASQGTTTQWILKGAWVCEYKGPDMNASDSKVAIEKVELAYEELVIPV
jgi:phage tail-like protein